MNEAVAPQLELHPELDPNGAPSANMMVRWCVQPELREKIKAEGLADPYCLLLVRPYREGPDGIRTYSLPTQRKLVPLLDEASHVMFSRPGMNEVLGCVVYSEEDEPKRALKAIFTWDNDLYSGGSFYNFFDWNGNVVSGTKRAVARQEVVYATVLPDSSHRFEIEVDKKLFAKEPPQWFKDYQAKFYRSKPKDQCKGRSRKAILAAIALPYFTLAYSVRTLGVLVGLLFGLRGVRYNSFLHPLKYNVEHPLDDAEHPIWWKKSDGSDRSILFWPLNPVTPLVSGLILWGIGTIHVTRNERRVGIIGWEWWQYFAVTTAFHLALAAALVSVFLIGSGIVLGVGLFTKGRGDKKRHNFTNVFTRWMAAWRARREAESVRATEERKRWVVEELERMACRTEPAVVSFEALPKGKRSLKLRSENAKRKVCKPYAR